MRPDPWGHNTREFQSEYNAWNNARARCVNPKHPDFASYGGRGITMCDRWLDDFDAFVDDMGRRPTSLSLERMDNNQGYDPFNCIWATWAVQMSNRRAWKWSAKC